MAPDGCTGQSHTSAPSAHTISREGIPPHRRERHVRQLHAVQAWCNAPAQMRLIGCTSHPENASASHMSGDARADWFDLIVHSQVVFRIWMCEWLQATVNPRWINAQVQICNSTRRLFRAEASRRSAA